jgi:ribosomal protein S13
MNREIKKKKKIQCYEVLEVCQLNGTYCDNNSPFISEPLLRIFSDSLSLVESILKCRHKKKVISSQSLTAFRGIRHKRL